MANPLLLRLKPVLTLTDVKELGSFVFKSAVETLGNKSYCSPEQWLNYLTYAVQREVGGMMSGLGFPTNIGNKAGYVGILQNYVDNLIESNALTKDNIWRARHPVAWSFFPKGIHPMYTRTHRSQAIAQHLTYQKSPRNIELTASDNLVAFVVFLDTVNWACNEYLQAMSRLPTEAEVYAFHLHGYPLMTDYVRLKAGRKPLTKGASLAKTTERIKKQLAGQSAEARRLLANIGTA